jgi:hypothetical protein
MMDIICIDVVGATKEISEQEKKGKEIQELVRSITSILECNHRKPLYRSFQGDGEIICFDDNRDSTFLLAMNLHKRFPQPNSSNRQGFDFQLRIGISSGITYDMPIIKDTFKKKIPIDEAPYIGIPLWGPAIMESRRLCDLCDGGHILLNNVIAKRMEYENCTILHEHGLRGTYYSDYFQPLGEYQIKNGKEISVVSFVFAGKPDKTFGNKSKPGDKRGLIERIVVPESLFNPLSEFHEENTKIINEGLQTVKGIGMRHYEALNLYGYLFRHGKIYNGTNIVVPSEFWKNLRKFLDDHERLVNATKQKSHRIMIMEEASFEIDHSHSSTKDACENFIRWHYKFSENNDDLVEDKVTLLQITLSHARDVAQNYNDLHSLDIGIWQENYALQFGEYDEQSENEMKLRRLWLSPAKDALGKDNNPYKDCSRFFDALLQHRKLNRVYLDECDLKIVPWDREYYVKL